MNRRQFLVSSSFALAGASLSRPSAWTQPTAAPVTAFNELRRGVGYFTGQGGTIGYVVTGDGAIAVDSQFPATAGVCVEGLKQKAPKGIELLVNTHHHGDHTGGNTVFKPVVKHIVCQEKCLAWHKKTAAAAANPAPQAYADLTFGESWSATLGDEKVWAFYNGTGHTSGDAIAQALTAAGHDVVGRRIVRDDPEAVRDVVRAAASNVPLIVTTGGTGITSRDSTYEAIVTLLDKRLDGFGELFRMLSYDDVGSAAMLSRACAGTIGSTAIFALPGSERAVKLAMEKLILPEIGHVVRELNR